VIRYAFNLDNPHLRQQTPHLVALFDTISDSLLIVGLRNLECTSSTPIAFLRLQHRL
jgi:hypothetical protein